MTDNILSKEVLHIHIFDIGTRIGLDPFSEVVNLNLNKYLLCKRHMEWAQHFQSSFYEGPWTSNGTTWTGDGTGID